MVDHNHDRRRHVEASKNGNTFKEGPACPAEGCYNDGFLTDYSDSKHWPFRCSVCGVVFDPDTGASEQGYGALSMPQNGNGDVGSSDTDADTDSGSGGGRR